MDAINPLSLVGMSMSARKRRARYDWVQNHPTPEQKARRAPQAKRNMLMFVGMQGGRMGGHPEIRAALRIGERLRPCWRCLGRAAFREDIAGLMPCDECKGTGVSPARKAVPRVP